MSGTLTPDQATAAEQAVTAFWAALGSNNTAARGGDGAARAAIVRPVVVGSGGPTITVSALHITVGPARRELQRDRALHGQGGGELGGKDIPVFPQAPGSAQWLATTEVAGHWYVNIEDSTALLFAGACD